MLKERQKIMPQEQSSTSHTISDNRSDKASWEPGDACGVCGSTNTYWDIVDGGCCRDCHACDSDE